MAAVGRGDPPPVKAMPMTGFTLTGFNETNGYKEWDLQGGQALVQPSGQSDEIPIKELKLHLFNNEEPPALESTIESPEATVYMRESVAKGPGFLYIKSDSYTVEGQVWDWDGKQHLIHVGKQVQVTFVSAAVGAAATPGKEAQPPVIIHSERLEIQEQPGENHFLFSGNVNVTQGTGETTCRTLEVFAARAKSGAKGTEETPGVGQIERIIAHDEVIVHQDQLEAMGQLAQITPADDRIVLSGSPFLWDKASDALLTGGQITWWRGRHEMGVEPEAGKKGSAARVHVSLPPLASYQNGASKPATGPDAPRLLVSGEMLHASLGATERRFVVDRAVRVTDPSLTVDTDHLEATFDALPTPEANSTVVVASGVSGAGGTTSEVGRLNHLLAVGNVVIHQPGRVTTTQQAEIFPPTGEVVLTGSPRVEDAVNQAVITGNKIVLLTNAQLAQVTGSTDQPASLTLPALPGLEAGPSQPGAQTRVTSDQLNMERGTDASHFVFTGHVHVTGQDMETTCTTLEVFTLNASPSKAPGPASALGGGGDVGQVIRMLAKGQVVIHQRDYEAHAAVADIYPRADVAEDVAGGTTVSQPHRFVELFGDPTGATGPVRPTVVLPPMGNLGWGTDEKGNTTTAGNSTAASAPTVITSDQQQLFTSPAGNQYWFDGNVQIDGGEMQATCEHMHVLAAPPKSSPGAGNTTTGGPAGIEKIVCTDQVRVVQGTRTATAGEAEIFPDTGDVVLTQQPLVVDSANGTQASGDRLVLKRGQREAFVEGAPATATAPATRPTAILPAFNFDNFEKAGDKQPPEPTQPTSP
jgi:lipopolysaccharide export system protein LptA